MEYKSLKKIYHIDERKCQEVYERRFYSESACRLGIKINDFECFYFVNNELLTLIGNIYTMNMWFDNVFQNNLLPPSSKHYLMINSLIEEIRSSNKIEGIYSTQKEIQDMLSYEAPKKYRRFYGMVHKYKKIISDSFPMIETSLDIRKLYDEILLEDVVIENQKDIPDGLIFRNETVEISSGTQVIHRGVHGEKNIIEMMDQSLKILNDENINMLVRVAIFHYLFEYIHPFYNGNGRMGRFISSGYLSKHLNILCAFQFSIACLHKSSKYYKAFELTNDIRNKSDLTPFIISFLEIYLAGLEELKEKIEYTSFVYNHMKVKIENYVDNKFILLMDVLLQGTLFGTMGLTMSELVETTSYTEQTLRSYIKIINKDETFIKINKDNKPYQYTIDIDLLSHMK